MNEGEHPVDALLREVREETGIFEFENLEYLYEQLDNKVFLFVPKLSPEPPSSKHDPDQEFTRLEWFDMNNMPANLDEYAEDIIFRFMRKLIRDDSLDKPSLCIEGRIDVLVDGQKVYELNDDEIWETLPRLAQERSKGKKVEFKQILDDGTIIDQTPQAMPDFIKLKKVDAEKLPGGLADDKAPEDFDPDQLRLGMHIELEHTDDKELAQEIAMDHLMEDSHYYVKLRKMEGMKDAMDIGTWMDEKNAPEVEEKNYVSEDAMSNLAFKVYVDGKHFKTCKDAAEIETIQPEIIKKRNNGHDVQFKQILDTGEEIDFTLNVLPDYFNKIESSENWERSKLSQKIHKMINELLNTYIPEEKNRPTIEIVYNVHYLGKTVWKETGDANATHIVINNNIVKNDSLLRQVLSHEIIHHHLYQKYGNDVAKHGEHFDELAARINAKEGEDYVTEFANDTAFR